MSEVTQVGQRGGTAGGNELADTEIHHILSNERRRFVLDYLREDDEDFTLRELSERIAEEETGQSPAPRNIRQSVYVSLHQTHLPKLDNFGIVDYDSDSKEVQLRDQAREVNIYLETAPTFGIAWSEFYLAMGVLGLLTLVGTAISVPLLDMATGGFWAAVCLVIISGSALYQTLQQKSSIFHRLNRG